jgi:hypothetical protein
MCFFRKIAYSELWRDLRDDVLVKEYDSFFHVRDDRGSNVGPQTT